MRDPLSTILNLADVGERVSVIALRVDLSESQVYNLLREHRPNRTRSPRRRTSTKPAKIRALAAIGTSKERVGQLLGVSRAYVYRWWPATAEQEQAK